MRPAALPHLCAHRRACCSASASAPSSSFIRASIPAAGGAGHRLKKITVYLGVPTMHRRDARACPGVETMDLSSLRFCGSGGAPLPLAVQERFESGLGCRLPKAGA